MLRRAVLFAPIFLLVSCAEPLDPGSVDIYVRADGGNRSDSAGNTELEVDTGAADEAPIEDTGAASPDAAKPTLDSGTAPADSAAPDTTAPDTGTPDTGTPDVGTPDTGVVDTGTPPVDSGTGTTVTFPASSDSFLIFDDPWVWSAGDYIQGVRKTTLGSITSISGNVGIKNGLTACGSLDVTVKLNGTTVGTMKFVKATGITMPLSLTFPAITGPSYTLRYQAANTVAGGCGSVSFNEDSTTLTLK